MILSIFRVFAKIIFQMFANRRLRCSPSFLDKSWRAEAISPCDDGVCKKHLWPVRKHLAGVRMSKRMFLLHKMALGSMRVRTWWAFFSWSRGSLAKQRIAAVTSWNRWFNVAECGDCVTLMFAPRSLKLLRTCMVAAA